MKASFTLLNMAVLAAVSSSLSYADKNDKQDVSTEHVVVTSTGEARLKKEVAASIYAITEEEISSVSPSHPAEVLNRVPGVHINNLGGEGHMSSIRQPISTSAVYLFLEDGIPTRPTGFFNHNGLYEINIPQSNRVEVIKGPGSALYGSGAIGGVINVVTKASPQEAQYDVDVEGGAYAWKRALMGGGSRLNENIAARVDVNITDNEGYRDESAYDRSSSSLRIDNKFTDEWSGKTIASYSEINQSGSSSLTEEDFLSNPEKNRFHGDIGFREVEALRVSSEFKREDDFSLFALTPYVRQNSMTMMPSWMVTYDPNIREYSFDSFGLLLRNRRDISNTFSVVAGIDFDYTTSDYREQRIAFDDDDVVMIEQRGRRVIDTYLDYTPTDIDNYDFDAEQRSASPYFHTEWRFATRWRMNSGIRYDYFDVDYQNNLSTVTELDRSIGATHLRPDSQKLSYDHFSPKWSLLFDISRRHNAYVNYRRSFVTPSVGTLFRPGSSLQSTALKPITANSAELGLRGFILGQIEYELALYSMLKENDIVSIIDGSDRRVVNAGETEHKGIELGFAGNITAELNFSVAYTYTQQRYREFQYIFQCFSPVCGRNINGPPIRETRNFAGFDIGKAPEGLASLSLGYSPKQIEGLAVELEFNYVGEYFTDETNTQTYDGHELLNMRVNYAFSDALSLHLRVMNLSDELYSTYTSNQVNDPAIGFRPGLPRTAFVGLKAEF